MPHRLETAPQRRARRFVTCLTAVLGLTLAASARAQAADPWLLGVEGG